MSGGHWDYSHHRLREFLEEIADDKSIRADFPRIAKSFKDLSAVLYEIVHDLDWHLSCDTMIDDPRSFEKEAIKRIVQACDNEKEG